MTVHLRRPAPHRRFVPAVSRLVVRLGPVLGLALALLTSTTGCSTNPATGKSQLNLISEAQEIEMGRSADPQIVAQYGLYPDDELASYVDDLGQRMAAESERAHLPWTFRVLDDPVINAFALPGGYIYVTRGILGHMGSEAELVSVLGHEIGHVTARHSVNRLSKQQLAGLGLGVGAILAPEMAQAFGNLAQAGVQLMFLKYGRDDERQADSLGFRYSGHIESNPRGFVEMFDMLGYSSEAAGGDRLPGYLSTHPDPEERRLTAQRRLQEVPPEYLDRSMGADRFLRHLDGMPYGPNPREGFFDGNVFVHPEMGLRLELPRGWKGYNQKQAAVAVSPNQDAMVQLSLAGARDVDEAAKEFYDQQGVRQRRAWRDEDPDLPLQSTRLFAVEQNGQDQLYGAAGFVSHGDIVLRLMGIAKPDAWNTWEDEIESTLKGFGRLRDRQQLNVKPPTIDLVKLDRDMTLEEFQRRYPSDIEIERLAVLNHVRPGETLAAGTYAKRVRGFDPGPQAGVELK
jgi:predicted Zn-dependent protease